MIEDEYLSIILHLPVFLLLTGTGSANRSEILIDLVGLDVQSPSPAEQQPPASALSLPADFLCGSAAADLQPTSPHRPSAALALLDEELLSLGNKHYLVL